jgi:hypothetical protein
MVYVGHGLKKVAASVTTDKLGAVGGTVGTYA